MQKLIFKNLAQIYALLVCFILIFFILISAIISTGNIVNFLMPELEMRETLIAFTSPKNYRLYLQSKAENNPEYLKIIDSLSATELDEKRTYEKEALFQSTTTRIKSSLITSLQWLIISGIFFAAHWHLYRRFGREAIASR